MTGAKRRGSALWGLLAALIVVSVLGMQNYTGSAVVFSCFCACYLTMLGLIVPKPRVYAYTFFSALLFLGFWLKAIVQAILKTGFLEPTGDFTGTAAEWDAALIAASCAAAGVIVARTIQLALARRASSRAAREDAPLAPLWFLRFRKPLWLLSAIAIVAVNGLNYHWSFYQVGVNPTWVLPWKLNVLFGWLVNVGFALWVSALVWWEFRSNSAALSRALLMPLVEASLSSLSAFSRFFFLLHAAPYGFALFEQWRLMGAQLRKRAVLLAATFCVLFCVSVLTVFLLRVISYHEADYQTYVAAVAAHGKERPLARHEFTLTIYLQVLEQQLTGLATQRWVGLEGVLTVGSVSGRGKDLFLAALVDESKAGANSLFQRYAKPRYLSTDPDKFVFLTNAGVVAILWYSGSLLAVFAGMALMTGLLIGTERLAHVATGNPFLLSIGGLALANVATQMTFPYLSMIFLLQFWLAIAFLGTLERMGITATAQPPTVPGHLL